MGDLLELLFWIGTGVVCGLLLAVVVAFVVLCVNVVLNLLFVLFDTKER